MNKGPIKFANKVILKPTKEQVNYAKIFKQDELLELKKNNDKPRTM